MSMGVFGGRAKRGVVQLHVGHAFPGLEMKIVNHEIPFTGRGNASTSALRSSPD
jgi:hypothetical protein